MEQKEIEKFIKSQRWTFAKTMAKHPHEYIIKNVKNKELFEKFAIFIRKAGHKKLFFRKEYSYFDFGGYSYWTMGEPINETIVLNRKKI